jgi:hypothetical protein
MKGTPMKRTLTIAALALFAMIGGAELVPETLTLTWTRNDTSAYVTAYTNRVLLSGVTYRLTNCVVYGSTTATTQDLSGLTITLRAGDAGTNLVYSGSSPLGTNGIFNADIRFPTFTRSQANSAVGQTGLELTLADTNTAVSVTFSARKLFYIANPLQ